jgi:hypothetical protein
MQKLKGSKQKTKEYGDLIIKSNTLCTLKNIKRECVFLFECLVWSSKFQLFLNNKTKLYSKLIEVNHHLKFQ